MFKHKMTWMSGGQSAAVHRETTPGRVWGSKVERARSRTEPFGGELGPEIREEQIGHFPEPCLREVRAFKLLAIGQGDCSEGGGILC